MTQKLYPPQASHRRQRRAYRGFTDLAYDLIARRRETPLTANRRGDLEWRRKHRVDVVAGGNVLSVSAGPVGVNRSYLMPLTPGEALPPVPAGGFRSEDEVAQLPGARRIDALTVVPGPLPDVYAFSRATSQRNLYRIPVP